VHYNFVKISWLHLLKVYFFVLVGLSLCRINQKAVDEFVKLIVFLTFSLKIKTLGYISTQNSSNLA